MCLSLPKMNASSWRKAADLTGQETQAYQQVQAAATANSSQLESFPLSALSANDSGPPQVNYAIKKRVKYPNCLKVQNRSKPEAEVNLKENLMNKDTTHLKPKRQIKLMHMRTLTIIIIMITTMPQVRVKAADLLLVKAVINNLEVSHNETEEKDLNIVNVSFRIINIREAHPNKTVLIMTITANPIFREIKQITIEAEVTAVVLSITENTVMVGPTIRVEMEHTSISITHMTHSQNNMAPPAVYVAVLIILLSIVTRENMI